MSNENTQADENRAALAAKTEAWVKGWHSSPEAPFSLDQIADLYVKDHRLFSYDFGRPHSGVEGWDKAAPYYEGFMAIPKRWALTSGGDLRVNLQGDIAWTTLSLSGEGETQDGAPIDLPEARVTLIFERQEDGDWLIVHEHGSAAIPFPDTATTSRLLGEAA
ncbi:YybH family protein [Pelagibius sp.]|uniref:YybH family protein n=1 Tax=Pelagibius sp. TaxID=1931238 RepID=UPI003BAF73B1